MGWAVRVMDCAVVMTAVTVSRTVLYNVVVRMVTVSWTVL